MPKVVLFNKPYNVLSQFTDQQGRETLSRYIKDPSLRVAGRLDRDSEGLMVLTDSGSLAHKITQPNKSMSKAYWAQVEGAPTIEDLQPLIEGSLLLKDGAIKPAKCRLLDVKPNIWARSPPIRYRADIPDTWLSVQLTEGRNRQVRRMLAAVGFPVLRLIRYRVGSWNLLPLQPGEHYSLTI